MKICNIIIASRKPALWFSAAVLAIAPAVFAHAGFNHIMGTVAQVSGSVLTVKTDKGNIDVKLSDKTDLTREDRKAQISDLKAGTRVIAEVPEGSTDNIAQSVKIGAAPKTAAVRHATPSTSRSGRHIPTASPYR
jgi:hypothetical protein